jgi:F0F1-type ATP synthase assembly protein I
MATEEPPERTPQPNEDDDDERKLKKLRKHYLPTGDRSSGDMATAGLELGMIFIILAGIGWWADRKLGTSPWLLLLFCAIGIGGGLYRLVRRAMRR